MGTEVLRVSVVIPVHNGMPHLPETLRSVLNQTRPADEVVVVENGSTDGTTQWLRDECPPGVRVVIQPALVDAAANWTDAVRQSTGELVKLLCADDLLAPRALEIQAGQLERHPDVVIAAAQRAIVDDSGRILAARSGLAMLRGTVDGRTAVRRCALLGRNLLGEPCCVTFRRDALMREMPWDGSLGYVIDVDMYSRVLQHGAVIVSRAPLATFRMAHGSWSAQLADQQAHQIRAWIERVRREELADLNDLEMLVARVGVAAQDAVRKTAYFVARTRARFSKTRA